MSVRIGSNIASIQAQRRLGEATTSLSTIYERLSSGKRINKASDDAAGLSIAEDLNVKSRIFGQAIRNINDGISVHAIADGAVSALSDIVVRLKELTEQSANGTYSNFQRKAIDTEAQALAKEYLRVSRTTEFNGQKLFDGSLSDGLRLQVGIGIEGSILTHVGGKLGTGTVGSTVQLSAEVSASYASQLGDLNNDGILDLVTAGSSFTDGIATVRLGSGNGSFGAATSYITENKVSNELALGDLNGDGILDMVTAGQSDTLSGFATVRLGRGNGTFGAATSYTTETLYSDALALGDLNGDGILDLITAGVKSGGPDGYATIRLGRGNGTFGTAVSITTEANVSCAIALSDLNGDGVLDIVTAGQNDTNDGYATVRLGSGNGSFGTATSFTTEENVSMGVSLGDLNGDGFLDLVTSGRTDLNDGYATVRIGTGTGSFGTAVSFTTESWASTAVSLGDLDGDGLLDLVTAGYSDTFTGYATVRLGGGNGNFGNATSFTRESLGSYSLSFGDLNGDGVTDMVTSGRTGAGVATISLGNTRDGISPLQPFSLKTKSDSLQAMALFTNALNNLSSIRGTLGANESRLNVANATLAVAKENYLSASSRITDADMAQESANLVRTQILQQAGAAVLTQANQAPALAITLLR